MNYQAIKRGEQAGRDWVIAADEAQKWRVASAYVETDGCCNPSLGLGVERDSQQALVYLQDLIDPDGEDWWTFWRGRGLPVGLEDREDFIIGFMGTVAEFVNAGEAEPIGWMFEPRP